MVNYKAEIQNNAIIISGDSSQISSIDINNLRLSDGTIADSENNIIIDQQKINYFDSIKDGGYNLGFKILLDSLKIYPEANKKNNNVEKTKTDLETIESTLLKSVSSLIQGTSWTKVKKGSTLDPPKEYNLCTWESGLQHSSFISNPQTFKTFGSYIDPLEKQNADKVWPESNNSIELTESFMKLMGFSTSTLQATTKSKTDFDYVMNIKCGEQCNTGCIINNSNGNKYFSGNKTKNTFLKNKSGDTKEKIKYIVIKEWGDKMQVLIYFLYYHVLNNTQTITMLTTDRVVFCLCIILSIPCIYTGVIDIHWTIPMIYSGDSSASNSVKKYSILEYKPSETPYRDAIVRFNIKRENIFAENESLMENIRFLVDNPITPIILGNENIRFTSDFYEAILQDMESYQSQIPEPLDENVDEESTNVNSEISKIEQVIRKMEIECVLLILMKVKKGTKTNLTINMHNKYTLKGNSSKPSLRDKIQTLFPGNDAEKDSKKKFYEIGMKYFLVSKERTGGFMSGGNIGDFPETDDAAKPFIEYKKADPEKYYPEELEKYDLQTEFDLSFKTAFDNYTNNPNVDESLKESLYETIYSLYLYESFYNKCAAISITEEDIDRLFTEYIIDNDPIDYTLRQPIVEIPPTSKSSKVDEIMPPIFTQYPNTNTYIQMNPSVIYKTKKRTRNQLNQDSTNKKKSQHTRKKTKTQRNHDTDSLPLVHSRSMPLIHSIYPNTVRGFGGTKKRKKTRKNRKTYKKRFSS